MYFWLGICLSLAGLLVLNALTSLVAAAVWRRLAPRAALWPARERARVIFTLRTAPVVGSAVFVLAVLLPSFLANEPYETQERLGWTLTLLAKASLLGLLLAAWRGLAAWRSTRRLARSWLAQATPVSLPGLSFPAFRFDHPFPVVAVIGVLRPQLFIAESLLTALSPEELQAVLRHEAGHLAARDNLKRMILRACRDALAIIPCGRALDRAWAASAETAADDFAARAGANASLNLASALLKIARQARPGLRPTMPLGAYLFDGEENAEALANRVRHLARAAESPAVRPALWRLDLVVWFGLGGFLLLLLLAVWGLDASPALHHFVEHAVIN
jgi:Zn-dependent protease with chaperone function